jgi:homocitrate synthase
MTYILKSAIEVIEFVKSKNIEIRFSSEDSFRSDLVDLLSIYRAVDKIGVNRVGIADTVGCASPRQVFDLVRTLRGVVSCDIETHFHNDSGCGASPRVRLRVTPFYNTHKRDPHTAIANAYCALEAGATHIDTSVLGIGERNGITPLGGLIARMMIVDPEYVKGKYNLHALRELENIVAEACEIQVPFNNYITGFCAFTHKAGIHAKAILANPSTYEALNPQDFGMSRYIHVGSRVTGWHAVRCPSLYVYTHLFAHSESTGQVQSGAAPARDVRRPSQGRHCQDQGTGLCQAAKPCVSFSKPIVSLTLLLISRFGFLQWTT